MTWLYMMKQKSEVARCFKDFTCFVQRRFDGQIKVLRSDNGTEYTNKELAAFLSGLGILHQTTCPDTPGQNGIAERKNRHLMEMTRALMFEMNVPKTLWGEAVMTAV